MDRRKDRTKNYKWIEKKASSFIHVLVAKCRFTNSATIPVCMKLKIGDVITVNIRKPKIANNNASYAKQKAKC